MNLWRRFERLLHRHVRVCLLALLITQTGLLAWIALENSPVADEIGHLPAGISHWRHQKFDLYRVNPPLVRSVAAIPVLFSDCIEDWQHYKSASLQREEFQVGRSFVSANGYRFFHYVSMARLACIPFSLIGTLVCFSWAKELSGRRSGFLASAMWVFSPNILAHGSLITSDAAAASTGVFAAYMFWRWLKKPTGIRAFVAGVVLGLCVLTKTTWLILFAVWPAIFITSCILQHNVMTRSHGLQLSGLLLSGLYVLNFGYLFEGSMTPLGSYQFKSRALVGETAGSNDAPRRGNRFSDSITGSIPVPLPRNFVEGIDLQKYDFEEGQPSYLRGEWRDHGWSYYYLYALAVKVPLGTGSIFALTIVSVCSTAIRKRAFRSEDLTLLLPPFSVFLLASFQLGFNKHLRYVLPIFPFLFVIASISLKQLDTKRFRFGRVLIFIMLLWSAVSSLAVCPANLAYFNELAGGPENGAKHLLGSNLDWGQSLIALKRWNAARTDSLPLYVSYSGLFDPSNVGISCHPVPINNSPPAGWYAISMNRLSGYERLPAIFRIRSPAKVLEYSMAIFLIE